MASPRNSLITQANMLKLPRLNTTFQTEQNGQNKKNHFYVRPEIKKILYSPLIFNEAGRNAKQLLLQSCIAHKSSECPQQKKAEDRIRSSLTGNKLQNEDSNKARSFVHEQASFEYYKQYKKLDKLLEETNQKNKQNAKEVRNQSPFLTLLEKTQKLYLLPLTMGLIKFDGEPSILNASNYKLGDKYVIAMSAGLKKAKMIEKCFLSKNRITNNGFIELIKSMSYEVNTLDVSFNRITHLDDKLLELIIHPEGRLEKLNLDQNQIKNKQNIFSLVESINLSKHFKVISLRSNGIGMDCLEPIAGLIGSQTHLEELYLGRNFLTAKAGSKIFQNLAKNKNINVLDYSLNNLGEDENHQCAKAIANFAAKNKTIYHLDLSYNYFSIEGSKIIAEGLLLNKKIYGLHFEGNYGHVDSKGFLIVDNVDFTSLPGLVQSKINSYNIVATRQNSITPKLFKNVCWICEGWYEQQFKFTVPEDYSGDKKLVYIHFDFDLFSPRLINIQEKNVRYTTMVPPTKYRYFFTFNEQQYTDKAAKLTKLNFSETFSYEMNHEQKAFVVTELSVRSKARPQKIVNDWNQIIINTLPRNTVLSTKKEKQKWTYQKSIWAKEWKLDSDDLLKKCFQKDWKCSKIMNLVKNQQDQDKVKQILFKNYKQIKLAYRYFASWSPFGDVWAISNNVWTEFCQQSKIINKETPLKITDLTFITTNSISGADWKGNILVPERGLVRFQFMECLVRLSEEKFKKLGLTENFSESISLMIKEHVLPFVNCLPQQKWRYQTYFVEEIDLLVKKYRPIFSFVYKKNSKLKVKPGEKPFMCLNEFKTILERVSLAGNSVLQRDIYLSFNFAMMTQIDELENERFMKMTEIQFIEGLARCAHLLPKSSSLSQKSADELHFKFQWLINEIKKGMCNEDIKASFNEEGSIFDQIQAD